MEGYKMEESNQFKSIYMPMLPRLNQNYIHFFGKRAKVIINEDYYNTNDARSKIVERICYN